MNDYKFRTYGFECHLKTQNCGVVVKGDDGNDEVTYYGRLTQIIQLKYIMDRVVTLVLLV